MNNDKYVMITSLKSEPTCKLIIEIPGLCLLILSSPGWALRMHVNLIEKPRNSTSILNA